MKEKIFEMSEYGPFKAKVDERFHKLGEDCPDDGWVEGYLFRDLDRGEVAPLGFHIAQWIKVEDRFPNIGEWVMVYYKVGIIGIGYLGVDGWVSDNDKEIATPNYWMPIVPPKED